MRRFNWELVFVVLLVGLVGCSNNKEDDPPSANNLDLSYVADHFVGAIVVDVEKTLESSAFAAANLNEFSTMTKENVGLDLRDIKQAIILMTAPGPRGMEEPSVILRFNKPIDVQQLAAKITPDANQEELLGKPYYVGGGRSSVSLFAPDDKTLLIAPDASLRKMAAAKDGQSPLIEQLRSADADHDIVGAFVVPEELAKQMKQVPRGAPPGFEQLASSVDSIEAVTLTADVDAGSKVSVTVVTSDESAAQSLEEGANQLISFAKQQFSAVADELPPQAARSAQAALESVAVSQSGNNVTLSFKTPDGAGEVFAEAVAKARDAAKRSSRSNDLKHIVLAIQDYHDANRGFPPSTSLPAEHFDKEGRPFLSWRVYVCDYLGIDDAPSGSKIHWDKPWDSDENRWLLDVMPAVFRGNAIEPGETTMMMIVGKNAFYEGQRGFNMGHILDGTSNTICVVDAGSDKSVPWTKPEDLAFDLDNPIDAFGRVGDKFLAAFCDGSVRQLESDLPAELLRRMIMRNDRKSLYDDF